MCISIILTKSLESVLPIVSLGVSFYSAITKNLKAF